MIGEIAPDERRRSAENDNLATVSLPLIKIEHQYQQQQHHTHHNHHQYQQHQQAATSSPATIQPDYVRTDSEEHHLLQQLLYYQQTSSNVDEGMPNNNNDPNNNSNGVSASYPPATEAAAAAVVSAAQYARFPTLSTTLPADVHYPHLYVERKPDVAEVYIKNDDIIKRFLCNDDVMQQPSAGTSESKCLQSTLKSLKIQPPSRRQSLMLQQTSSTSLDDSLFDVVHFDLYSEPNSRNNEMQHYNQPNDQHAQQSITNDTNNLIGTDSILEVGFSVFR